MRKCRWPDSCSYFDDDNTIVDLATLGSGKLDLKRRSLSRYVQFVALSGFVLAFWLFYGPSLMLDLRGLVQLTGVLPLELPL